MEGPRLRGGGRLCRIRFTLDRIKAGPEATGRALQSNAVALATHGTFQPRQGACGRECDQLGDLFRGSFWSLVRWSGTE